MSGKIQIKTPALATALHLSPSIVIGSTINSIDLKYQLFLHGLFPFLFLDLFRALCLFLPLFIKFYKSNRNDNIFLKLFNELE